MSHPFFNPDGFLPPTGAEAAGSCCSVSVRKPLRVLQAHPDTWRIEQTSGQDPKRDGQ